MTFTVEQIPWPLWASFALALIVAVRLMGARYRSHPLLPFAAGVLVGLLVATTLVRASETPRAATVAPAVVRIAADSTHRPRPPAPPAGVGPSPSPMPTGTRPAADGDAPDRHSLGGIASWFRSPANVAAAGPDLRHWLGRGWRGTHVRVAGPAGTAVVRLGDWMRRDRLVDLDDGAFVRVCGPLSLGVCRVRVTRVTLPETSS